MIFFLLLLNNLLYSEIFFFEHVLFQISTKIKSKEKTWKCEQKDIVPQKQHIQHRKYETLVSFKMISNESLRIIVVKSIKFFKKKLRTNT